MDFRQKTGMRRHISYLTRTLFFPHSSPGRKFTHTRLLMEEFSDGEQGSGPINISNP
jgi:hypothetical protein